MPANRSGMCCNEGKVITVKKLLLGITLLTAVILIGCGSGIGKVSVETQSYQEDGGKLDKSGWKKQGSVDAVQGEVIYTNGSITATVENADKNGVRVRFNGDVVDKETNKSGNNFYVKKNRTYTFVAGGGTQGLEIKLRYN